MRADGRHPETGRLCLAAIARFTRADGSDSTAHVGRRAALTVPTEPRMFREPATAHIPEGHVPCGHECSAIGRRWARHRCRTVVVWVKCAVDRGPGGGDRQRSAGDDPARRRCLWHQRHTDRLPPLRFNVNSQIVTLSVITPRPSRNCQSVSCAQAPSRPEGRADARSERSGEPCTVPSTDRASIA